MRLAFQARIGTSSRWTRYGLAVLLTGCALLARWLLNPVLQGDSPFSIFILAVLISVWWGGFGPGLASLVLGTVVATYFFLVPQSSFGFTKLSDLVHFSVFVVIGVSVCVLGQRMRLALTRAERSELEARHTVGELAQAIALREVIEEQLRKALDAAEAAVRAKSAFMAYMSHEIRTPLNGVLGMLELLHRTELDSRQVPYVHGAKESAELLLHLLNDVLDFTKIESGRFELEAVEYRPAVVLTAIDSMFASSANEKKLRFQCVAPPGFDERVGIGDPARLRQVLVNLVSNAIKFSDQGEVVVSAELIESVPGECSLRFDVQDTGIGIDPEVRARLFQPFAQGDSSMSRRFGGSGLGLAISRNLVTMMRGTIDFESSPGIGSTFRIAIPFREVLSPKPAPAVETAPRFRRGPLLSASDTGDGSRRILVVEDNSINAEVAVTLISDAGYDCDLAITGFEALDLVTTKCYDLILMDCQLPGLDGFDTTRRIRQMESSGQLIAPKEIRLPILALTASNTPEVRERALAAGMDGCLGKPVGAEELLKVILANLPPSEDKPIATPMETSSTLMVDFDAALRRLGGRKALLSKLADQFLGGTGELIEQIRVAVRDHDANQLKIMVRRLKGQAATFDAAIVVDSSARLEALADGFDWLRIETEFRRLEISLPMLESKLTEFRAAQSD